MKRLYLGLSLLIVLMFLSGCIEHQGERPFDYPPARWISETPDLWFDVDLAYTNQNTHTGRIKLYGQLQLPDKTIRIGVCFNYTNEISVFTTNEGHLRGTCQFFPDKLIVTVDKENDTLLNGQYDTITFIRNEICIEHQGERPFDYPPARWISETPDFWFDVDLTYTDANEQSGLPVLYGQLQLPDQTIKIGVCFTYTNEIIVFTTNDEGYLSGTCQFYPDKLFVTVYKESDTLLNGQYDTITFIRNEIDEAASSQSENP